MSWCTIESDPAVFTELLEAAKVKDVEVAELFALDADLMDSLKPVHGLVFLFKHQGAKERRAGVTYADESSGVFFANQVISNACGTQALLHVVLNAPDVDIGPILGNFKDFTASFPPDIRGNAMNESEELRTAHNSFARPEPFVMESRVAKDDDDDVFHFVAYIPHNGKVYELDGLQPAPIVLGDIGPGGDWFSVVKTEIERRVASFVTTELRFTLLAVCRAKKADLSADVARLTSRVDRIEHAIVHVAMGEEDEPSGGSGAGAGAMDTDPDPSFTLASTTDELTAQRATTEVQLEAAKAALAMEEDKYRRFRVENQRRKHNYIPFIMALLNELGDQKKLMPLMDAAKERAETLRKAASERRKAAKTARDEAAKATSASES